MVRRIAGFLLVLTLLFSPRVALAEPGDELTIYALTIAPGSEAFEKFGHNALHVHDALRKRDMVYNWGMFSFEEDGLILKFLRGKLSYWLGVYDLRSTIMSARMEDRSVKAQELDLTASEKLDLIHRLNENAKPENVKYRYDYYLDNCTTRVRDLIDAVTHGALRAVSKEPAPMTFRGETSRLDADVLWEYIALNVAMGSYIDRPLTAWDETFVPVRLEELFRKVQTDHGPLVRSEKTLLTDSRAPIRPDTPKRFVPMLLSGLLIGGMFGGLSFGAIRAIRDKRKSALPVLFGVPLFLFTLVTFVLGTVFVFLWTCTDHQVAWHNENLFIVSPLSAVMMVVAVRFMRKKENAIALLHRGAMLLAASAVLGVLVKILPWFRQDNAEMLALFVPIWIGLAIGVWTATENGAKTSTS